MVICGWPWKVSLPPLHHSREVWNCHDLYFPLLWGFWPGNPKQQLWVTCTDFEVDKFALVAVFILVRTSTEVKLYRLSPRKILTASATNIVPLEIKYSSETDICGCLRFTENYLNLGCLGNYWFLGGSNVKQGTSRYVKNDSNFSMFVTFVSPIAENAELTQQYIFFS